MWADRRLLDLLRIEHPIALAPMAGAMDAELAIAVALAGGLGSLPVAVFYSLFVDYYVSSLTGAVKEQT